MHESHPAIQLATRADIPEHVLGLLRGVAKVLSAFGVDSRDILVLVASRSAMERHVCLALHQQSHPYTVARGVGVGSDVGGSGVTFGYCAKRTPCTLWDVRTLTYRPAHRT